VLYFRTEDNFAYREALTLHNTSKMAVYATFWLLGGVASDTFILDPLSMLLEAGQKQVASVLLSVLYKYRVTRQHWLLAYVRLLLCFFHYFVCCLHSKLVYVS